MNVCFEFVFAINIPYTNITCLFVYRIFRKVKTQQLLRWLGVGPLSRLHFAEIHYAPGLFW